VWTRSTAEKKESGRRLQTEKRVMTDLRRGEMRSLQQQKKMEGRRERRMTPA